MRLPDVEVQAVCMALARRTAVVEFTGNEHAAELLRHTVTNASGVSCKGSIISDPCIQSRYPLGMAKLGRDQSMFGT